MKKILVAAALGAASVGLVASPAMADPSNAKKANILNLQCDALGAIQVVTAPGNGTWTPGLVVGSNTVGIVYELHLSGTFTPNDGSPVQTFSEDNVKKGPSSGRTDTCTFSQTFTDENGTGTFGGTVRVALSHV